MKKQAEISATLVYDDEHFEELSDPLVEEMALDVVHDSPEILDVEVTEIQE